MVYGVLFHGVNVVAAIGRDDGAVFSNHDQNGHRGDGIHLLQLHHSGVVEGYGEPRGLGDHAIELAGILI